MRIFFVGGGTGGHFYPLIAIAESIRDNDRVTGNTTELFYMGPIPYNQTELDRLHIGFVFCPAGKRRRYASFHNFIDFFKILFGTLYAIKQLYVQYPDVIMSKGGYTSVPIVLAAAFFRIPIVIHESDAVPGRANVLAKRFAQYIAISYQNAAQFFPEKKVALTGIPIRKSFFAVQENSRQTLGIESDLPIIFITGGSLGAERINALIMESLDELLPHFILIHQAGADNVTAIQQNADRLITDSALKDRYFVQGHMSANTMAAAQSAASIIISRAGSTSIAEIALRGKPSIIIPIPEDVSHDQRTNAYEYARTGAASVLEEKNLGDGILTAEINRILGDDNAYQAMSAAATAFTHQDAAATLANTLLGIAAEHER